VRSFRQGELPAKGKKFGEVKGDDLWLPY